MAGTAIAAFLARRNVRVVLLERGTVGAEGATARSGAIVRLFDPDPALAEFGRRGLELFQGWQRLGLPGPNPFQPTGFLYIPADENAEATIAAARALRSRKLPVEIVRAGDMADRFAVDRRSARPAILEPRAGHGNPRLTAQLLAAETRRKGGLVLEHSPAGPLTFSRGTWHIALPAGAVEAGIVVVAAGAFSRRLVPTLEYVTRSIPIVLFSGADTGPLVDETSATYFCPAGRGLFLAGARVTMDVDDPEEIVAQAPAILADSARRAAAVAGPDRTLVPLTCSVGYDGYTADNRPVLGFLPDREGLYVAAGLSGRGYKYCLALGEAVAREVGDRVTGRPALPDALALSPFHPIEHARA